MASSEGQRWTITRVDKTQPGTSVRKIIGPEAYEQEVVPAVEVERLQGEVVDLRRERDDEKALALGLSNRVAEYQAEVERLHSVLEEIADGNIGKGGTPGPIVAAARAALHPDEKREER